MIKRLTLGLCIAASCAAAPIDWPHLKLTRVAQGLNEPVCVTSARDGTGRVFIAERFGKVKVLVNGQILPEPFLDISNKLNTEHYSHGILGLAFPPGFATQQHLYVHYTPDRQITVLSRFHVPPGSSVVSADSEDVILTMPLAFEGGPSAGDLGFGPDGYLYIFRDASNTYQPQHFDNPLGKILRIDVHSNTTGYVIPPGNPFATHPTHRREIWSWGFFHPHSLSFDRLVGDLYIIDRQGMRCEVNFQGAGSKGGMDYGSPVPEYMSGSSSPTYERPVHIITSDETFGLTGLICRDISSPRMNGIYFMGHLRSGQLAGLARDGTNWVRQNFPEVITPAHNFGEDESGRLYAMSRYEGTIDLIEDSGKVRPPVLPPSGVSQTDLVSMRLESPGARIRYTTDGRDPGTGDPEFPSGHTVTISTGIVLKAQALREDLLPSDISVVTYSSFKVAYPIFVPGPGTVPNPTFITITSATPGAVIRYTTNRTHPTQSSPIYASPVVVPGDAVVYARAYRDGFQESDLNGATYAWATAQAPVFNPLTGPITNGTRVTITSATPGAKIRYTLDGTEPAPTSPKYTNSIRLNGTTTIKAVTFSKGYKASAVTTMRFDLVKPERPVLSPSGGIVAYGAKIQISCATPGVTIRYTTNGLAPSSTSPIYSKPISIFRNTVLKARAFKTQMDPSFVARADFQLPVTPAPVFTPPEGVLTGNTLVTISCATSNAQIRYTLDGTPPGAASTLYRGAIRLLPPATLSARAFAFGMNQSGIAKAYYPALIQQPVIVQTIAGSGVAGYQDGPAATAMFKHPRGLYVHEDGTIYVADTDNHTLRKISTNNMVSTLPTGALTFFFQPVGIAVGPGGSLYVVETPGRRMRIIAPDGQFTTINVPVSSGERAPWHIAFSSTGTLYIGSSYEIFTMTPAGKVSRFAGDSTSWGWVTSVALNPSDKLFAVTGAKLLTFDGAQERRIAGGAEGFSDGPGLQAQFRSPSGIAVSRDKKLFIADGHLVRMFHTGHVSTVAGHAGPGFRNGPGSVAQLVHTDGLFVDKKGVIYVTDYHAIRKISFDRDGDTIPDPEDASVGIDDRQVDSDGDGQSNAAEYWAATNPYDSSSTLKIQASYNGSNGVIVSWPTAPARSYVLSSSTNLADWQPLAPAFIEDGHVLLTNSLSEPRSFFRLRVEP